MVRKRIVCLANSRKLGGRCVAGKDLAPGQNACWVRPVSVREHEELLAWERRYQDGSEPRVLDIMEVTLLEPRPRGYQQENWLLDGSTHLVRVGRFPWNNLGLLADPVTALWINNHNTINGLHDKIPLTLAGTLRSSLHFIHVDWIELAISSHSEESNAPKRRVQGRFLFGETEYRLWVTDPIIEHDYSARPDGGYRIGRAFLTISLSEPFNDHCYKLVAAIIERDKEIGT